MVFILNTDLMWTLQLTYLLSYFFLPKLPKIDSSKNFPFFWDCFGRKNPIL